MYTKMFRLYKKAGVITKNVPSWRQISNSSIVSSLKLSGKGYEPEGGVIFDAGWAHCVQEHGRALAFEADELCFGPHSHYERRILVDTNLDPDSQDLMHPDPIHHAATETNPAPSPSKAEVKAET